MEYFYSVLLYRPEDGRVLLLWSRGRLYLYCTDWLWVIPHMYFLLLAEKKKEERSGHPLGPFTSPNTLSVRIYLQIRIFINDAKYRLTWPWPWPGSLPFDAGKRGGWDGFLLNSSLSVHHSPPVYSIQHSNSAWLCCHHAAATDNNRLPSVHDHALQSCNILIYYPFLFFFLFRMPREWIPYHLLPMPSAGKQL